MPGLHFSDGHFRPRNTLNGSHSSQSRGRRDMYPFQGRAVVASSPLLTRTAAGQNVSSSNLADAEPFIIDPDRPTKRRKTRAQSRDSDIQLVSGSSQNSRPGRAISFGGIDEYKLLEKRMRSDGSKRRAARDDNDKSEVIAIQSRAKASAGKAAGADQRTRGEQMTSSLVEKSRFVLNGDRQSSRTNLERAVSPDSPAATARKLLPNGRRKSNLASSPDELLSATTVGNGRDAILSSPEKRRLRDGTPTRVNAAGTFLGISDLEPSNIKPTDFESQAKPRTRSLDLDEEDEPDWHPLAGLSLPGQLLTAQEQKLGFAHKKQTTSYRIYHKGRPLRIDRQDFELDTQRLQKIQYATNSNLVRFTSSRVRNQDYMLDILFPTNRDATEFLKGLQIQEGVRHDCADSSTLEKMFQHRRSMSRPPIRNDVNTDAAHETRLPKTPLVQDLLGKANDKTSHVADTAATQAQRNRQLIMIGQKPQPLEHNSHLVTRKSARLSGGTLSTRQFYGDKTADEPVLKSPKFPLPKKAWSTPLTYPKEGKRKATVDFTDLDRLDEGEFLNDAIVAFYSRYLEEELQSRDVELFKQVFFFNSFFFERLTSGKRSQGINYSAVQSWTRNADLFGYKYIVVPINESAHWYLALICNISDLPYGGQEDSIPAKDAAVERDQPEKSLGEGVQSPMEADEDCKVARQSFAELDLNDSSANPKSIHVEAGNENEPGTKGPLRCDTRPRTFDIPDSSQGSVAVSQSSPDRTPSRKQKRKSLPSTIARIDLSKPLIVLLDSLGSQHNATTRCLKDYIAMEGEAKKNGRIYNVNAFKGVNAKGIPHQTNYSDCGLFMLGYLEKFLRNPQTFLQQTIRQELPGDGAFELDPSMMRNTIRTQLIQLGEIHSREFQAARKARRQNRSEVMSSPLQASDAPIKGTNDEPSNGEESGPAETAILSQASEISPVASGESGEEIDNVVAKVQSPAAESTKQPSTSIASPPRTPTSTTLAETAPQPTAEPKLRHETKTGEEQEPTSPPPTQLEGEQASSVLEAEHHVTIDESRRVAHDTSEQKVLDIIKQARPEPADSESFEGFVDLPTRSSKPKNRYSGRAMRKAREAENWNRVIDVDDVTPSGPSPRRATRYSHVNLAGRDVVDVE